MIFFFAGLEKGQAPPPPPTAPPPRTPSEEERSQSVNLDVQGLNISQVRNKNFLLIRTFKKNVYSLVFKEKLIARLARY